MGIEWATGKEVPVRRVRRYIGMPHADGSTSWDDLKKALKNGQLHI
jgi:hypothetical protein